MMANGNFQCSMRSGRTYHVCEKGGQGSRVLTELTEVQAETVDRYNSFIGSAGASPSREITVFFSHTRSKEFFCLAS